MTKINKLHFNGIDYDIGDKDIHDLTAKSTLVDNDEFMIADSENGNVHKKVTKKTLNDNIKSPNVELLIVGGGGGGGSGSNACIRGTGGGGGGGIIHLNKYSINNGGVYDVVVGKGGQPTENGKPSSFGIIGVHGGGAGGRDGGNGGGANGSVSCAASTGGKKFDYCPIEIGNNGGNGTCGTYYAYGSGGGGAGGIGCTNATPQGSPSCDAFGRGGKGLEFDITGESVYYSTGGSGGGWTCNALTPGGGHGGTGACKAGDGTTPGSGGGGGCHNCGIDCLGCGADGVVIVSYPTACGYNLNGGYKYTCGTKTIHCFKYDGQFGAVGDENIVSLLLIGGGGGGGGTYSGGGGGAGGLLECLGKPISQGAYNIVVGCGGLGGVGGHGCNGGDTCVGDIVAYGGGGGGASGCGAGCDGGSGGGGGGDQACTGGVGTQGCCGGNGFVNNTAGGGGGGYTSNGCNYPSNCNGGAGGTGYETSITGTKECFAGGGGGGGRCSGGANGYGGGSGGKCNVAGGDATTCGSGGGGTGLNANKGGDGAGGIVVVSYPSNVCYSITGGNCCYECNGNCIHIFTSDGTLTVN